MLKIGYIGNGKSTNRYHLPFVLPRINTYQVKKIYARSINKRAWERMEGVEYTDSIDELLNDESLDLICVCTSTMHYEYAKMVLEHGKHCLVEKPFTNTAEQAKELFALAKEKGLVIQAYQNRRYDSDFLTMQKVIESGKLGDILEVEMHFDYYRPEIPMNVPFNKYYSYLYSHGCHTIDQVLGYFGKPDDIHYDVRQLLGKGHMNDYFDLDFYYGAMKVSIKSSYFRIKARPSLIVYGKKGMFIKADRDRQEEHLKGFYMPTNADFGVDSPQHYGTLTYIDDAGLYHEEKVVSEVGDYGRVYDDLYNVIVGQSPKKIIDAETIWQLEILEKGIAMINES